MIKGTIRLVGITFIIAAMQSCGEVDLIELNDFERQLQADEELISSYIAENNISNIDSTDSGIRYAIVDQGEGASPAANEFVSVDYYAQDLDGIIYASNIKEVADTSVFVPISQTFDPIVFTYSQSGWTLDFVSFADRLQGDGLKQAIGKSFIDMREGGQVMIFLPSGQAFGPRSSVDTPIPDNSVLIYTIFLREVIRD